MRFAGMAIGGGGAAVLFLLACTLPLPAQDAQPESAPAFIQNVRINQWVQIPRHAGNYPELQLVWQRVGEIADVSAVWPHPLLPSRAIVAAGPGLLITSDGGRSFAPLAAGTIEKIGVVTDIAFPLDQPDAFFVSTKRSGVWVSRDGGKSLKQIASKATGLAHDSVLSIEIHAGDVTGRTLLACHGDAAPGLSRSIDGGQTWEILHKEHHVFRVFTARAGSQGIFMVASKASDPEAQGLFIMPSLGEPWQELMREVACTGFAAPLLGDDSVLVSTADRGLLRIARNGGIVKRIGPENVDSWASIGATWGANADSQVIFGLDAKKLGMVVWATSTKPDASGEPFDPAPNWEQFASHSKGLYTNAIVREGAHLRANANGTIFYAAINSMLYRAARGGDGLQIVEASAVPLINRFDPVAQQNALDQIREALAQFPRSRNLAESGASMLDTLKAHDQAMEGQRIIVTAKIRSDGAKPQSVTVDLSRLGLSPSSALFDDGQHEDQAAGDGVYAGAFPLSLLTYHRQDKDWRRPWPGVVGLTVTAADSQSMVGAVIPYSIVNPGGGIPFWEREQYHEIAVERGKIKRGSAISSRGHRRGVSLGIEVPGPWRARLGGTRKTLDISGAAFLVLQIRTAEDCADDILVHLRDEPVYAEPVTTPGVPLLAEGLVPAKKFTTTYQRVAIPIARLLQDAEGFQSGITHSIVLSGTANRPVQIMVDEIMFSYSAHEQKGKVTP